MAPHLWKTSRQARPAATRLEVDRSLHSASITWTAQPLQMKRSPSNWGKVIRMSMFTVEVTSHGRVEIAG